MGGMGKTTVAVKVAESLQHEFEYVIWRSLQNLLPAQELLEDWIKFLSDQQEVQLPDRVDQKLVLLVQLLRNKRCLLILDNIEVVLQAGNRLGDYRSGYEDYGYLFQTIGEAAHQSCLLLTSREQPKELTYLEGAHLPIRSLQLKGLDMEAGRQIFNLHGKFLGSAEEWQQLIDHYAGNPLAIKMVVPVLQDFFESDIPQFLQFANQNIFVFDNIRDLLERQFNRLSDLEEAVMYWLAINREPIALPQLRHDFVQPPPFNELVNALNALQRRSLIEKTTEGFTQLPVVMEYTTEKLIHQVSEEITNRDIVRFQQFALMKAQTKDYLREAQTRLILEPIANRLIATFGTVHILQERLARILAHLRYQPLLQLGYAGGNSLNLLRFLGADLTGFDASHLAIWQAYLVGTKLYCANFSGADLSHSKFTTTLTATISVVFSPDRQFFAIGNADGEARVWSALEDRKLLTCQGHTSWICCVKFSPDSQLLATSSFDQSIRLWHLATGECLKTLIGHHGWVWSIAFSPDGHQLVSGSTDGTMKLWDLATGECTHTFTGHANWIRSVAWHPIKPIVAASGHDATIRLWDLSGKPLRILNEHQDWVAAIDFSPDGTMLLSGSHDQTLKLWDTASGECLQTIVVGAYILSVAFSTNGQMIATGHQDHCVRVWDVATGQCLKTLQGHMGGVWSVAFHPDDRMLASGSHDSAVRIWDAQTGQSIRTLQGYGVGIRSLSFSRDSQWLMSGNEDETIKLWHLASGKCQTLRGHQSWIWQIATHPHRPILASCGSDLTVRLWDLVTAQPLQCWLGHTNIILSIAFHPQGHLLASGSFDQTIRLWDVQSGQCQTILEAKGQVCAVAFSPEGKLLATGQDNGTVMLWDVASGTCTQTLNFQSGLIFSIAFSPDGKWLAISNTDRTVRIYQFASQTCSEPLRHEGQVYAVAFHPDGHLLASAGEDRVIRIWDSQTHQLLYRLEGHQSKLWSIAFSPDGKILASSCQDGLIKLWDPVTGECISSFRAERPYEQMNITGITGMTEAQKASLKHLGAYEEAETN